MDIYDREVERLTKEQLEWEERRKEAEELEYEFDLDESPIYSAWNNTTSILFGRAGKSYFLPDGNICGCLTQVRSYAPAWTPELTAMIRADDRIPKNGYGITVDNLHVFAEWRRKMDAMGITEQPI